MWPFKGKKQRTLDEFEEKKQKKIPRRCHKILKELEKAAPNPVHSKDLAFKCNLSPIELGSLISSYPHVFHNVEKIDYKEYVQYRLNLDKKYPPKSEETPKKGLFWLRKWLK